MKGNLYIGTSGWSYDHWQGIFYPQSLKPVDRLQYYVHYFNSVEINYSFYRLPSESSFKKWKNSAPEGFIYSLKGSRFITHMKKLKDSAQPLSTFMNRSALLMEHLGPVLFQLPPRWPYNPDRLIEFIGNFPENHRFTFEFRDHSWFSEEALSILKRFNVALCIYSFPGFESPRKITSSFAYIRFHGSNALYSSRYSKNELRRWAEEIKRYLKKGIDVYAYFNNDAQGNAVINAQELKELIL